MFAAESLILAPVIFSASHQSLVDTVQAIEGPVLHSCLQAYSAHPRMSERAGDSEDADRGVQTPDNLP